MGTVGPYQLGDHLILLCLVDGGDPPPAVIWTRDGEVWDSDQDKTQRGSDKGHRRNSLVISHLDRGHSGATFSCRATNNNVTVAPTTNINIHINMPILDIR